MGFKEQHALFTAKLKELDNLGASTQDVYQAKWLEYNKLVDKRESLLTGGQFDEAGKLDKPIIELRAVCTQLKERLDAVKNISQEKRAAIVANNPDNKLHPVAKKAFEAGVKEWNRLEESIKRTHIELEAIKERYLATVGKLNPMYDELYSTAGQVVKMQHFVPEDLRLNGRRPIKPPNIMNLEIDANDLKGIYHGRFFWNL